MLNHVAERGTEVLFKSFYSTEVNQKNPTNNFCDTLFHFATEHGHLEIGEMILDVGENKHPKNRLKKIPYDWAEKNGHFDIFNNISNHFKGWQSLKGQECQVPTAQVPYFPRINKVVV